MSPFQGTISRGKYTTWNLFVLWFGGWTLHNKVFFQTKERSFRFQVCGGLNTFIVGKWFPIWRKCAYLFFRWVGVSTTNYHIPSRERVHIWVVVSTIFIFTLIFGRFPFWLIFFKWIETTNQISYLWKRNIIDSKVPAFFGETLRVKIDGPSRYSKVGFCSGSK